MIPYGRQNITQDDVDAVVAVLKSDYLTQGPNIRMFEESFAEYIGCDYALAVSNGTAALHLCTMALELYPGEKVITTPLTFVATANSVKYCGAEVDFADINPDSFLIDIENVRRKLESSPKGTYKGIIVVDFAGYAVNLEEFRKLADEYECWIIEDACHSPGGFFLDSNGTEQHCGNGNFADLSIFSFHPVKHIASGEGGMITTNNKFLYEKIKNLRTHGIQQDPTKKQFNDGVWYYEMQELGYNYRLADINAALGMSQLKRAESGLKKRREIAARYLKAFNNFQPITNQTGIVDGHAYHLYIIEIDKRDELIVYLREKDIFAQVHYIPVHLMPYYRQLGWKIGDMPKVEDYYKRCLSIPIYPTLTEEDQGYVIKCIKEFYE